MHSIFYKRTFVVPILLLFLNLIFYGCYSSREITLDIDSKIKIYKIEMVDGKKIDFKDNEVGYAFKYKDKIISIGKKGEIKAYQISEVKKIYTEKFDYVKTFFFVIGSAAVLFIAFFTLLGIQLQDGGFG